MYPRPIILDLPNFGAELKQLLIRLQNQLSAFFNFLVDAPLLEMLLQVLVDQGDQPDFLLNQRVDLFLAQGLLELISSLFLGSQLIEVLLEDSELAATLFVALFLGSLFKSQKKEFSHFFRFLGFCVFFTVVDGVDDLESLLIQDFGEVLEAGYLLSDLF